MRQGEIVDDIKLPTRRSARSRSLPDEQLLTDLHGYVADCVAQRRTWPKDYTPAELFASYAMDVTQYGECEVTAGQYRRTRHQALMIIESLLNGS